MRNNPEDEAGVVPAQMRSCRGLGIALACGAVVAASMGCGKTKPGQPETKARLSQTTQAPLSASAQRNDTPKELVAPTPVRDELLVTLPAENQKARESDASKRAFSGYFSPDSTSFAFPVASGEKQAIVVNGKRGSEFDAAGPAMFVGQSAVYWGSSQKRSMLVVDNVVKSEFDSVVEVESEVLLTFGRGGLVMQPQTSEDGRKWAVVAKRRSRAILIALPSGEHVAEADQITGVAFGPRPDCPLAYAARSGRKWSLVVDSKPGPSFDAVGPVSFGSGGRYAYPAKQQGRWQVVESDRPTASPRRLQFDGISNLAVGTKPSVVYAARRGGKWFVVEGESVGQPFDEVGSPVLSQDGRVAYVGKRKGKAFAVFDGQPHGPYEDAQDPEFNRLGFVFVAVKSNGKWNLLKGIETVALGVDSINSISFDDKGEPAMIVRRAQKTLVVRGKAFGQEFDDVAALSRVPKGVCNVCAAYAAKVDKKWHIVEQGRLGPAFDEIEETWLGPKNSAAYVGVEGKLKRVVVGNVKGPPFDEVWVYGFDQEGSKIVYGAMTGQQVWRKVLPI